MANIEFDYSKLRGRIVEICGSQRKFSIQMGMDQTTLCHKLQNSRKWTQGEILKATEILAIPDAEIVNYFFSKKS